MITIKVGQVVRYETDRIEFAYEPFVKRYVMRFREKVTDEFVFVWPAEKVEIIQSQDKYES